MIELFGTNESNFLGKLKSSVIRSVNTFLDYIFVLCLLFIVVVLTKASYGELRPFFFDVCRPTNVVNCETGTLISDYHCSNPNLTEKYSKGLTTSSFPSGDAAMAAYFSVFLGVFLQRRFSSAEVNVKFLRPCVQCLLMIYAFFCSISRVIDNYHHPHDVLFGALLGSSFALYNVRLKLHDRQHRFRFE